MTLRYLSFFSGIGGFEHGLEQVFGRKHLQCLGFSEVDKNAIAVYSLHFPDHKNLGDITKIDFTKFKDVDLIVAGSPCQDLSGINTNGAGLKGLKSRLFFKFIEALQVIQPKYFILENVFSMNNHSRNEMSDMLGVEPVMINAACFGPQDRKRLFWANFLIRDPEPCLNKESLYDVLEPMSRVKNLELSEKAWVYMSKPYHGSTRLQTYAEDSKRPKSKTVLASPNIPSHVLIDKRFREPLIRTYTITELERLQGFENWVDAAPISNTAKTKAIGNALNGDVAIYLASELKRTHNI
jgi:DNA (cytosine-5)-methyltransferase 3A